MNEMYLVHVVFGKPHKNFSGRGLFIELVGLSFSWDLNNNRRPNEHTSAGLTWQQHEASPPLYSPSPQPRQPQSKIKKSHFAHIPLVIDPQTYLSTLKIRTITCPSTALWLWSPGLRQFRFPTFNKRDEFVQRKVYQKNTFNLFIRKCWPHLFHNRQQSHHQHAWSARSTQHYRWFSLAPRRLPHLVSYVSMSVICKKLKNISKVASSSQYRHILLSFTSPCFSAAKAANHSVNTSRGLSPLRYRNSIPFLEYFW